MAAKKGDTLPLILLAVSIVSIAVTAVLLLTRFYFFFIPFSLGLPWSVKKLRKEKRKWDAEGLR